jgi:hypothetical protein
LPLSPSTISAELPSSRLPEHSVPPSRRSAKAGCLDNDPLPWHSSIIKIRLSQRNPCAGTTTHYSIHPMAPLAQLVEAEVSEDFHIGAALRPFGEFTVIPAKAGTHNLSTLRCGASSDKREEVAMGPRFRGLSPRLRSRRILVLYGRLRVRPQIVGRSAFAARECVAVAAATPQTAVSTRWLAKRKWQITLRQSALPATGSAL